MNYQLFTIHVGAHHLSRVLFSMYGDGYIVGSMIRAGMGSDIEVSYISSTDTSLTPKSVTILVIATYNTVPEFEMHGYVPVGVVDKNGKIYGVFAKFD